MGKLLNLLLDVVGYGIAAIAFVVLLPIALALYLIPLFIAALLQVANKE